MSLTGVVLGAIFQFFFAGFLFLMAAFAGGGIANGSDVSRFTMAILNGSIYLLPCLCLLSGGMLIYSYTQGATSVAYWWHAVSVVAGILYFVFAMNVN